ncbi:MAG TPA: hypothetical protein VEA59_03920 [Patescibacteria group bacterium]|nr:hypothetical protein [Patescibacteria group bacterium]
MPESDAHKAIFENLAATSAKEIEPPTAQLLQERGAFLHLREYEIETKLQLEPSDAGFEQIPGLLREALTNRGYEFVTSEDVVHKNYSIYYKSKSGRGKIIARNEGEGGFQFKQKSQREPTTYENIIMKGEAKSPVFETLTEAEQYMGERLRTQKVRDQLEAVVEIKKTKLLVARDGADAVKRYFLVVIDESRLPENPEAGVFRQIEIEYKGSDREQEDLPLTVQMQMERMVSDIQSIPELNTARTLKTKRKWAKS